MMKPIVMVSDFGIGGQGIPALKGVCKCVDPALQLFDLCHAIPPMDAEAAAEMIAANLSAWPENAVFVSAVDPGYMPGRAVCAYRLAGGQTIVAPVKDAFERIIKAKLDVAQVDDVTADSAAYAATQNAGALHGRDLAYCAAKLACK